MSRRLIAGLVFGLLLTPLCAGEFNKKVNIGDAAPNFSKLPGTDGKEYALDSFKDKEVFVIVITCNECPVAQSYRDRIVAFTKKYAGDKSKVGVVGINVNPGDKEDLAAMKEYAKKAELNFPYVRDQSQQLGKTLGATRTPEFFVFNKDRKLVYTGAMDDDQQEPKVNYLEAAVEATLKGAKIEKAETRSYGCGIQYIK